MKTQFQKWRNRKDNWDTWKVFLIAFGTVGGAVGLGILSVVLGWN